MNFGKMSFAERYHLAEPYGAGGMYKAVASTELVAAMTNAGYLAFFGTGGLSLEEIQTGIQSVKSAVGHNKIFGVNFLHNPVKPELEMAVARQCLENRVRVIEASAFMNITPALVWYRVSGLRPSSSGVAEPANHVIAKLSHPLLADVFLQPPPANLVAGLLQQGLISEDEAALSSQIPMASDITMEGDSGGHTDQKVLAIILPAVKSLRDRAHKQFGYLQPIHIGAAGGIGTPWAMAAALCLGAEYIITGSVNQCTLESGASEPMKEMLNEMTVYDTAYAPAGDLFELGSRIQVLSRGTLFPARARKLYELYKQYPSLDALPDQEIRNLETRIFKRPVDVVKQIALGHIKESRPGDLEDVLSNPKLIMSNTFKWYFYQSTKLAMEGNTEFKSDFQIQCGPALGAMNEWLAGTHYSHWQNRKVAEISALLISAAKNHLNNFFSTSPM